MTTTFVLCKQINFGIKLRLRFYSSRSGKDHSLAYILLFSTTKETVEYDMIPLRKDMEDQIASMTEVEGFESMTGDDAFLPGLKDYYTNKLTQNIAIGMDVASALDDFDEEWEIAWEAVEDAE